MHREAGRTHGADGPRCLRIIPGDEEESPFSRGYMDVSIYAKGDGKGIFLQVYAGPDTPWAAKDDDGYGPYFGTIAPSAKLGAELRKRLEYGHDIDFGWLIERLMAEGALQDPQ